jgi:hypothetical protein
LPDLICAGDRAAEDEYVQLTVELANRMEQRDAIALLHPEVEDNEIDASEVGSDLSEQLLTRPNGDRDVARRLDGRPESIAHECGVVGYQYGSSCEPGLCAHRKFYRLSAL